MSGLIPVFTGVETDDIYGIIAVNDAENCMSYKKVGEWCKGT
jgi:hypothetical protein